MLSRDLLSVYLNNHLGASAGGLELFRRVAREHAGTSDGDKLEQLVGEVDEDRRSLRQIMARLDVKESPTQQAIMWVGEKAGRLKPNGYVLSRSPLSDVIEMEMLRIAVVGKLCGWQTLRAVSTREDRLDRTELEVLIERANSQLERLYDIHMRCVRSHADELVVGHEH